MSPTYAQSTAHLQECIRTAIDAADPARLVTAALSRRGRQLTAAGRRLDLAAGRLFLVSVGKAALPMGLAAAAAAGPLLHRGIILRPRGGAVRPALPPALTVYEGDHPITSAANIAATGAIAGLLAGATAADHVLCLISGGSSALLSQPRLPLPDWQALNQALLASGCDIQTFNTVRRFFDGVKGGGLARLAAPAGCTSLILSDVIGSDLAAIGSGPTVPAPRDPAAVQAVLTRYNIAPRLSPAGRQRLARRLAEPIDDAPIPPPHNEIIGDIRLSANAAAAALRRLGFQPQLLTSQLTGEAREVGRVAAALALDLAPGRALLLGGETTVTLRGGGRGGRNQELALAALLALRGAPSILLASCASDGVDGPTDAAGAFITGRSAAAAAALGLDPAGALANNDAYPFFQALAASPDPLAGGLIHTGPTGTNVNDLLLILGYG